MCREDGKGCDGADNVGTRSLRGERFQKPYQQRVYGPPASKATTPTATPIPTLNPFLSHPETFIAPTAIPTQGPEVKPQSPPSPPSHTGWVFGFSGSATDPTTGVAQSSGFEYIHADDDGTSSWYSTYSQGGGAGVSGPFAVYYGAAYGVTTASDDIGSSNYNSVTLFIIQGTWTHNDDAGSGSFTIGISPGLAYSQGFSQTY
jgi:hypothetical protein